MPDWLTIILSLGGSTLISAIVMSVFNHVLNGAKAKQKRKDELLDSLNASNETLRKGLQAILRHELYDLYNTWIPKGYCPNEVKNDFENIYTQYHSLGKNGVMNKCRDEFEALPSVQVVIRDDKEPELRKEDFLISDNDNKRKIE